MNVIERMIKQATEEIAYVFCDDDIKTVKVTPEDIAELKAIQEQLRPRPMDEADHNLTERLIYDGSDFYIGIWSTYFDMYGEIQGPTWTDASDRSLIKSPECWWPLDKPKSEQEIKR